MDFSIVYYLKWRVGGRYNIMMYGFERPYVDFRALLSAWLVAVRNAETDYHLEQ